MERSKTMTEGSEWKLILLFTLPLMAGKVLLQQLYNTVDGVIVGNFVGETDTGRGGHLRTADHAVYGHSPGHEQRCRGGDLAVFLWCGADGGNEGRPWPAP